MSTPLAEVIRAEISTSGPMPFRRYMELALYHPQFGYYTSRRARIGRGGDFFTNVSVGPLFGKLLARQFAEMWQGMGAPARFTIVEQGANDGQFALDVMRALEERNPECFAATTYRIVEPSSALAAAQRERLTGQRVEWFSALETMPPFAGVHFSNELIDAFPVHAIEWTGDAWRERYVAVEGDGFVFAAGALSTPELNAACARIPQSLPAGYVTEVNLAGSAWIAQVASRLERGCVLAVDYGYPREQYYDRDRVGGTISAYAQHRRETDPLARPGEIDLTAHVEFTSLIEAAAANGLRLAGFTDQHHFMVGIGMGYLGQAPTASDLRAFKTLMHPSLMGQVFKVAGFAKGDVGEALSGFRYARSTT